MGWPVLREQRVIAVLGEPLELRANQEDCPSSSSHYLVSKDGNKSVRHRKRSFP